MGWEVRAAEEEFDSSVCTRLETEPPTRQAKCRRSPNCWKLKATLEEDRLQGSEGCRRARDQGFTVAQSLQNEICYCYKPRALIQLLEEKNSCSVCVWEEQGRETRWPLLTLIHKSPPFLPSGRRPSCSALEMFVTLGALQQGCNCNSSPASSSLQESRRNGFLGAHLASCAPERWQGGRRDAERAASTGMGCTDPVLRPARPPRLPQAPDLISRAGIRQEFSTRQPGRNHGDFCFPLYRGVENIWAYQLPTTARAASISNASGCLRQLLGEDAQPRADFGVTPRSNVGLGW